MAKAPLPGRGGKKRSGGKTYRLSQDLKKRDNGTGVGVDGTEAPQFWERIGKGEVP